MSEIRVCICENNDQGERSGEATRFMFHHDDLELFLDVECNYWPSSGVPISTTGSRIQIYGVIIKFSSVQEWSGNIYWNAYTMPAMYALGLINVLQRKKEFSCSEAWTAIYEKWESGELITATDLELDECDYNNPQVIVDDPNQMELFKDLHFEK